MAQNGFEFDETTEAGKGGLEEAGYWRCAS